MDTKSNEDNKSKKEDKIKPIKEHKEMGRKKKIINKKQFENLCSLQLSKLEICAGLDITDKTLDRWVRETYNSTFSEVFKDKKALGVISLRRSQFRTANSGNATMLIYLDKKITGYKDERTILQETRIKHQREFELEKIAIEKEKLELLKARFNVGEGGEDDDEGDGFIEAMFGEVKSIFDDEIDTEEVKDEGQ